MKNLRHDIVKCIEHAQHPLNGTPETLSPVSGLHYHFRKRRGDMPCFEVKDTTVITSYFIGVDWIQENRLAIHVEPKLNKPTAAGAVQETDFLHMVFSCLRHPDVATQVRELYEIRWDKPGITITQRQDLLTPLLVVQFLQVTQQIVRKGLKKSYYTVERNLRSRMKGKTMVAATVRQNLLKNRNLDTVCRFEEFGVDGIENRLIKKTLSFIQRYLPTYWGFGSQTQVQNIFNYIHPAFAKVSDDVDGQDIRRPKRNCFYREYDEAVRLAKLILARCGYNLSKVGQQHLQTPPFWIDMSKLFELYVLGLLKDRFRHQVNFQFKDYGNELDYILKTDEYRLVIDAKYKPQYLDGKENDDIRQVSGYARSKKVYEHLEKQYPESIDCLIIYPDLASGVASLDGVGMLSQPIPSYYGVYKLGVKLPTL